MSKRPGQPPSPEGANPSSSQLSELGLFRPLGPIVKVGHEAPDLDLVNAQPSDLPETFSPELATLATSLPSDYDWILENKFDGYRILARIDAGDVRLFTRSGHDWTAKLGSVKDSVKALGLQTAWLDGEIVALNDAGLPDFNRLQNSIDEARSKDLRYFVFDSPYLEGFDLRQVPLEARREALREVLSRHPNEAVLLSEAYDVPIAQLLTEACVRGLEGVVAKRADSPYVSARTQSWLKLKCAQRQELVVVGFTDRVNHNEEVGALFLAYYDKDRLTYAGAVGTGWGVETGRDLRQKLARIEVAEPPVDPASIPANRLTKSAAGSRHWVTPSMVVEVSFAEWTPDAKVRHASFRGIRTDKTAKEVVRELPKDAPGIQKLDSPQGAPIVLTHGDRVIDPITGKTKLDLARYYDAVASRMLPHLQARPASLVRAPQGTSGHLFFQKHIDHGTKNLTQLDADLWPEHDALFTVESREALLEAVQLNTIEFHTWNSTSSQIHKPDRIVFDLDPGANLPWADLCQAAMSLRQELQGLGLAGWLKTSGGKGLHVVVPINPLLDYDVVKNFSQAVVQHMARTRPGQFVAQTGSMRRIGKVFIDFLRNGFSQTTVAAFSTRARAGLGVSIPMDWKELDQIGSSSHWTIVNALAHLEHQSQDPWADYWTTRQTLTKAWELIRGLTEPV